MSNTEDFEEEAVDLDGEFGDDGVEAAGIGDEGAEETFGEDAPPPPPAKKGGAGKFLVLLLVLLLGGGAGAVKLELVELPFDIPGLTPEKAVVAKKDPAIMTPVPDLAPASEDETDPMKLAKKPGEKDAVGVMPSAIGNEEEADLTIKAPGSFDSNPLDDAFAVDPAVAAAAAGAAADDPLLAAPGSDPFADMGEPPADEADTAMSLSSPGDMADAGADPLADPMQDVAGADPFADPLAMQEDKTAADTTTADDVDPFAIAGGPDMDAVPVKTVETAPVPAGNKVAAGSPEKDARISTLEKRVATLEKDLKAANARADKAEKQSAKDKEAAQKAEARAVKAASSSSSSASSTPAKPRTTVTKTSTSVPAKAAAPAPRWVLKSAKPGVAWVALPGTVALKTVAVGDTLSGIGKVTAVAKNSAGRWVVSGTRGTINQ